MFDSDQWFWADPSRGWSYVWALVFLFVPFIAAWCVRTGSKSSKPRPFIDLVTGADGQWSTSKTAFILWTFSIWFAFLAILFDTQGEGLANLVLQEEYLVVLGIPAASAIAAKGIVESKIASQDIVRESGGPQPNVLKGIGELVSDENGRTDIGDFQYFGFNLILLGFFFLRFFEPAAANLALPDLPNTLIALTGVSAAAYVGKKGVEKDVGPKVRSVVPPAAVAGGQVVIYTVNTVTAYRQEADVLFGSLQAPAPTVTLQNEVAQLTTSVPTTAPSGQVDLVVDAFDGRTSEAVKFTIL